MMVSASSKFASGSCMCVLISIGFSLYAEEGDGPAPIVHTQTAGTAPEVEDSPVTLMAKARAAAWELDMQQQRLNRMLWIKHERLARERDESIRKIQRETDLEIHRIHNSLRFLAVALPPIPPLLLGVVVGTQAETNGQAPTPDEAAAKSLAAEYTDLIPSLIAALGERDPSTHAAASATLVALGREAVPALLQAIEDDNVEIRSRAAYAVGNMASGEYVPREAVPVLIKALKDEDHAVKQAAANAIKQLVISSKKGQSQASFGRRGGRGGFPQRRN